MFSEFKYLGGVWDKSGINEVEYYKKWQMEGGLQVLLNLWLMVRVYSFECTRVLHESLLVAVLMYGSVTMIWKMKEECRIRALQMDNLKGLLDILRMNKISNAQIRDIKENIDKGIL